MEEEAEFSNLISEEGYTKDDEDRTERLRICLDRDFGQYESD